MGATEHASRDTVTILERRHCLAEIVERGAVGFVEAGTSFRVIVASVLQAASLR